MSGWRRFVRTKGALRKHVILVVVSLILSLFVPASLLGPRAAPVEAAVKPGWIVSCNYSHSLPDDPIVFPAQPGAAHLHDFVGARSTDANSTPGSLRAGGTTCALPADTSAYWLPALWIHDGKTRVQPTATPKDALFYYRRIAAPSGTIVQTIPKGLSIVVGNASAASPSENPQLGSVITFKCGPGLGTELPQPPEQCASGVMVSTVRFPNCWNGLDLDSPDHRSHMAYPTSGRCPTSHPVVLPRLETFFRYPVGTEPIGTVTLSSGGWWTAHQDFLNAWEPAALQQLIDRCINAGVDCKINPAV
jgi:hypothetical protein